jgi:WD40 repeat protein
MKKNSRLVIEGKNSVLISILIFILFFSILFNANSSYAESPRNNYNYNYFYLSNSKNVSGLVHQIKISPDQSMIAIKTASTGVLLKTSDFSSLCNFSTFVRNGFEWNPNSIEFADGKFIRNKMDCSARDILYGDSISWNKDNHIASVLSPTLNIIYSSNLTSIYRQSNNFTAVAWNSDGTKLAAAQYSKVNILNTTTYSINNSFLMESDESSTVVSHIKWSPDSKYIAYSSGEFFIQIINVNNNTISKKLYGFTSHVTSFSWSSDGKYIVAGSSDKTVNIYDLPNDVIYTLNLNDRIPVEVSFGKDYHEIFIGTSIGSIEHWRFDKDLLRADAGPEIFGIADQSLTFIGVASVGEIPETGFTWVISDSNGPMATLTGSVVSFSFSQIGVYDVQLTVKDVHGRESKDTTHAHIIQSETKPVVTIIYPTNHTIVSDNVTIKGTATGNSNIRRIEIQINEGGWQTASGTNNWQFVFNSRNYLDGAYVVNVRAFNDIQSSDIVDALFSIDNSKSPPTKDPFPTIKILTPQDQSIVKGTILISGIASDNTYISEVRVELPNGLLDANGGRNWSLSFNTREVPDGKWPITATAYDEYNQMSSVTISIFINNTGLGQNKRPTIGIIFPSDNSIISGSINISGWASDDHELKIIQIRINDSIWHTCSGHENWKFLFNSSQVNKGPLIIKARAFDGHLFSANATLVVRVANHSNGTQINNTHNPSSENTYIISYISIIILVIFIIILLYFIFVIKKIRIILSIVIVILLITIIILWPTITNHEKEKNNTSPIDGNPSTHINNTTYAPDFTFMSMKADNIITNEKELGHVVFIYFTWEGEYEGNFNNLKELTAHYKVNGTSRLHIIVLLNNTFFSDAAFNATMRQTDPSWDYQQDTLGIRTNFNQPYLGKGWIIIDKNGKMVLNELEAYFYEPRFESIIDPLMGQ